MKPLFYILGFITCLIFSHSEKDAQAVEPEIVFVEYQTDYCSVDDIGLVKLSLEDIEETL